MGQPPCRCCAVQQSPELKVKKVSPKMMHQELEVADDPKDNSGRASRREVSTREVSTSEADASAEVCCADSFRALGDPRSSTDRGSAPPKMKPRPRPPPLDRIR
mmetsp:Transcript_64412/g.129410  ORF Transcript_64412/g.129410 Transcript_64412/m.129410 type:complete len:104 (-) Transcript_64412:125-436(-)